jgi:DNA-directed RNA polymerase subunit L
MLVLDIPEADATLAGMLRAELDRDPDPCSLASATTLDHRCGEARAVRVVVSDAKTLCAAIDRAIARCEAWRATIRP